MERSSGRTHIVFVFPRCSGSRRRTDKVRVEQFPRVFVILSILREIQNDLETKEHQARRLQGPGHLHVNAQRHLRKKNGENCISNAEEVRTYATKFTQGHWTFLGPGSEEKRYGDSHDQEETVELHRQQKCTAIQTDWSSCLQKHQCFESWNLEAKERQMYHSLQWRFYKYRTLVPNSSLCQPALSVFGAVANWCYQFGLIGDGKGRIAVLVNN